MDLRATVDQLLTTDVTALDAPGVRAALASCADLRSWVDATQLQLTARHQTLAEADAALAPAEHLLVDAARTSKREAGRLLERSSAAALAPGLVESMAEGRISAEHVDALATAVRNVSPDTLDRVADHERTFVLMAEATTPDEFAAAVRKHVRLLEHDDGLSRFERQRRANRFRWWTDRDGMVQVRGQLDPEIGLRVTSRIDATADSLFHDRLPDTCPGDPGERQDHLRALALDQALLGQGPSGHAAIVVTIDLPTLQHGLHDRSIVDCEGVDLPVDTIRRMACDAEIVPVVLDGSGVALDVGRSKRLATTAQRRALQAMYGTCAFPGCSVRIRHTVAHHTRPWEQGGGTDLHLLLPLCSHHHHMVHEGGWQLDLHPATRVLTVTSPSGEISRHPPPRAQEPPAA
jgi:hypothetical protein